jgi:hypothetical protein
VLDVGGSAVSTAQSPGPLVVRSPSDSRLGLAHLSSSPPTPSRHPSFSAAASWPPPASEDEDAQALADGYRFLLSPRPTRPPRLSRGFLYGLPGAVAHTAPISANDFAAELGPPVASKKDVSVPPHRQVPNWASATQRFFETAMLDELRRASDDVLLSREADITLEKVNPAPAHVFRETLSGIQDVIARHLSSGTSAIGSRRSRVQPGARSARMAAGVGTLREAVIEIGTSDRGSLSVRLLKSGAPYKNAMRFKSIGLDCSALPKLDTSENVEHYATQIREALCSHPAIKAEACWRARLSKCCDVDAAPQS